jgi:hypothetical protein
VINRGFVSWWVGANQYAGLLLTALLLVAMLLRHWNTTAVYAIFCFGYERRISVTTLADGVLTVASTVLLIRKFGVIGAPLGAILGVCLISLPGNLTALARESGVSLISLVRPLWSWFYRFVLFLTGGWLITKVFVPTGFIPIAVTASVVAILYGAIMFPIVLSEPLGSYVRPRLKALVPMFRRKALVQDADA